MKIILTVISLLILLFCVALLYNRFYIRRRFIKIVARKNATLEPIATALAAGNNPNAGAILELAADPTTRIALFRLLEMFGKTSLFPSQFYTLEKSAESFMIEWLEFPTELGSAPVGIHLHKVIPLATPLGSFKYYVFKFTTESHSYADHPEWMLGVCGPYQAGSVPFDTPLRVYSRFKLAGSISAELEAYWVHTHIKP